MRVSAPYRLLATLCARDPDESYLAASFTDGHDLPLAWTLGPLSQLSTIVELQCALELCLYLLPDLVRWPFAGDLPLSE